MWEITPICVVPLVALVFVRRQMGEEGQADVGFLFSFNRDVQDTASSNVRVSPAAGVSCAPSHRWHLLIAEICYRMVRLTFPAEQRRVASRPSPHDRFVQLAAVPYIFACWRLKQAMLL